MSEAALLPVLIDLLLISGLGQAESWSSEGLTGAPAFTSDGIPDSSLPDAMQSIELRSGRLQLYPLLDLSKRRSTLSREPGEGAASLDDFAQQEGERNKTQVWAVSLQRPVHHAAVESLQRRLGGGVTSYVGAGTFLVSATRETLLSSLEGQGAGVAAVGIVPPELKQSKQLQAELRTPGSAGFGLRSHLNAWLSGSNWREPSSPDASTDAGSASVGAQTAALCRDFLAFTLPLNKKGETEGEEETRGDAEVQCRALGARGLAVSVPSAALKAAAEWLSRRPEVEWLELDSTTAAATSLHNWRASAALQSGVALTMGNTGNTDPLLVQGPAISEIHPLWGAGLNGRGQVLGMGDSGIDMSSCYFRDDEVSFTPIKGARGEEAGIWEDSRHRKVIAYKAIADWEDAQGHGTHVAGSAAGNSSSSEAALPAGGGGDIGVVPSLHGGLAPGAKIAFSDIVGSDGLLAGALGREVLSQKYFNFAYERGARVHSDSWGGDLNAYDSHAAAVDLFSWSHPEFLSVVSAGNSDMPWSGGGGKAQPNSITSPATAKNSLAVGASLIREAESRSPVYWMLVQGVLHGLRPAAEEVESFEVHPASFGSELQRIAGLSLELAAPQPQSNPCQASQSVPSQGMGKRVVVSVRSRSCSLVKQVSLLQQAGATAVVLVNDVAPGYFAMERGTKDGQVDIIIPAVSVPKRIGDRLLQAIRDGQPLQARVERKEPLPGRAPTVLAGFSAMGPTQDGRFKPEVIAPGVTTSALSGESCSAQQRQGTSMAAPLVAASALIVRQYFEEGFYPSGARVQGDGFSPSGALVKAVLINGAAALDGVDEGEPGGASLPLEPTPSFRQGFGGVSLNSSLPLKGSGAGWKLQVVDQAALATGEIEVFCLESTGGPLRVTLAWHDHPGSPAAQQTLINDLDLSVRVSGLRRALVLGNSLADRVNNVEQVVIEDLPAGPFSIEIRGTEVPLGPQPYSMAVSGAIKGVLGGPKNPQSRGRTQQRPMCAISIAKIDIGPSGLVNTSYPTFAFSTEWGGDRAVGYECMLTKLEQSVKTSEGRWQPCTSPWRYRALEDGAYEFQVRGAGEPLADIRAFVVDTEPPRSAILSRPAVVSLGSAASIGFEAADDGSAVALFRCRFGNALRPAQWMGEGDAGLDLGDDNVQWGNWKGCSSPLAMEGLAPADYKVQVRASDAAGNEELPGASFAWRVEPDATKEFMLLADGPREAVASDEVTFSFVSYHASPSPVEDAATQDWTNEALCHLEAEKGGEGRWVTVERDLNCRSPVRFTGLSEGRYRFTVEIKADLKAAVGLSIEDSRAKQSAEAIFRVDRSAPVTVITDPPSDLENAATTVIQFQSTGKGEHVTFQCRLTAAKKSSLGAGYDAPPGGPTSAAFEPCKSPKPYLNLPDGRYLFQVRAVDSAGNIGDAASAQFQVDRTPPAVSGVQASAGGEVLPVFSSAVSPRTVATSLSEVSVQFKVGSSSDNGSEISSVFCVMQPKAAVGGPQAAEQEPQQSRHSLRGSASGSALPLHEAHAEWQLCSSPRSYRLDPGRYAFSVQAVDGASNAGSSQELAVVVDREAPHAEVAWAPSLDSPVPPRVMLKLVATDPGMSPSGVKMTECRLERLGGDTAMTPFRLSNGTTEADDLNGHLGNIEVLPGSWVPCSSPVVYEELPAGEFTFAVRATDFAGNVGRESRPHTFVVNGALPLPSGQKDFADWGYESYQPPQQASSSLSPIYTTGPGTPQTSPAAGELVGQSDGPLSMDPWMIGTLSAGLVLLLAVCAAALFLMCRGDGAGGSSPAVGAMTPGKGGFENLTQMGAFIQGSPSIRKIRSSLRPSFGDQRRRGGGVEHWPMANNPMAASYGEQPWGHHGMMEQPHLQQQHFRHYHARQRSGSQSGVLFGGAVNSEADARMTALAEKLAMAGAAPDGKAAAAQQEHPVPPMGVFEQPDLGGGGSSNSIREFPELQFSVEMPQRPQRHSHRRSASMGSHPGAPGSSAQLKHHHQGYRDRRRHQHHHYHHGGAPGKRQPLKRASHNRSDSARGEDYIGQLGSGASTVRHHSTDHKANNALPPLKPSSVRFYGGAFNDSRQQNISADDDLLRLSYGSVMGSMNVGGGALGAFGAVAADVNPHAHKRQRSNDLGGMPLPHLLGPIFQQQHQGQGGLPAASGIEMTTTGGRSHSPKGVSSAAEEQQRHHQEHPSAVVLTVDPSDSSLGSVEDVPKDSCRDFDVL